MIYVFFFLLDFLKMLPFIKRIRIMVFFLNIHIEKNIFFMIVIIKKVI